MEFSPMIIFRFLPRLSIAGVIVLTCGIAGAQHDVGGGTTRDVATPDSSSRTKRTTTRTVVRKPRPPVRRGITAEQYNKQGDEFFTAEEYDDALEAYNKAVQLKPIASAFYHIGWIYNDRDQFTQAIEPPSRIRNSAMHITNSADRTRRSQNIKMRSASSPIMVSRI